jgi:Holliday junction resolvase
LEKIWVIKESGEREKFSPGKVRNAVRRAGLSMKESDEVLERLRSKLYDGITTNKIYALTYELIEQMKPEVSHKYNLKRALLEIGPEGYEFEDFTAKLLSLQGYRTELRQVLQGRCVTHEVDVLASKGEDSYMIECKYHNQPGAKCRIQTVLYVYARFLDLNAGAARGASRKLTKPWLITNTKFSDDVLSYAQCMDIPLLGWRYPMKDSLETMIDRTKCYPITVIKTGPDTLRRLLENKIVTVFDLPESAERLSELTAIPIAKARDIVERAEYAR